MCNSNLRRFHLRASQARPSDHEREPIPELSQDNLFVLERMDHRFAEQKPNSQLGFEHGSTQQQQFARSPIL